MSQGNEEKKKRTRREGIDGSENNDVIDNDSDEFINVVGSVTKIRSRKKIEEEFSKNNEYVYVINKKWEVRRF